MKLEQIVPPLELCKKIPEGAFADSAAVFVTTWACPEEPFVATREEAEANGFEIVCPAPTLAEIMEALPTRIVYAKMPFYLCLLDTRNKPLGDWQIGYAHEAFYGLVVAKERRERDKHPPTAALRLWLDVEGVHE